MEARQFKDEVFGHFARIGAALGHAKRVEILDVLSQGERSVESLAQQISATLANTSRHLQILASAGLVTRRVEGTSRVYRLADPAVETGYRALVALAEQHIAEVTALSDAFFRQADGTRPVTFSEFDEMSRTGEVVLVDVRPPSEFDAGHVEGAVNIPVADLATRMTELPPDANVVAYCRGPYCVMAATAVTRLRESGYQAVRLEGGYPQWRDAGRTVTS
ncbi:MAG: metalloregulator ArsR/SmtB family transcription factor [Cellulomonas sp.]|uniref:metalloregulator ArsR/SmtB family transcription factor n=1 Tax=Cellulomonas sp. TaxID=40001 RepID=UPI001805ABF2|nr:metalloregulator ArsR/SmtB family transcription factor [Cellulomonas sp.]NMM30064.1 metalloregulator ArsR/SmtB family transcription factor [Cellulomonas sp.]